jgi:hypothetical protein
MQAIDHERLIACVPHSSPSPLKRSELLKPLGKPLTVRVIDRSARHDEGSSRNRFDPLLKQRTVIHVQERIADVDLVVWIEADEVQIEGSMMELRKRQAVRDNGLAAFLISITNNMGSIQEARFGQA